MLHSLKATLLLWVVLLVVLLIPVRLVLDLQGQTRLTDAAYDVSISRWALALGNLVHVDARSGRVRFDMNEQTEQSLRTTSAADSIYYAVLDHDGELLSGDHMLAQPKLRLAHGERRMFSDTIEGLPLRIAVHAVECGKRLCQVRVAETLGKRESARSLALTQTLSLGIGGAALFGLAVWWGVSRALRPLQSINAQLAERSLDDLRPLRRGRTPSELKPLLDAVDQLLARVAADATRQRHFIADAAHQLRTPLTALRTESELALLEPHPSSTHGTLERLHRLVQRTARLADQLLALARSEASSRDLGSAEALDLKAVVQDAAQDWVPRALRHGADLGFQLDSAPLRGQRHLLGELLGNLIHNALEYAAEAHPSPRITVRTGMTQHGDVARPMLEVEDNGPGIPPAEREHVFERFYRPDGSVGSGSGLGLAIVRDIAQAHGAEVLLLDAQDGTGLLVRVQFPVV